MTDKELLELAAKAAGYEFEGEADRLVVFPGHFAGGFSIFNDRGGSQLWNPLTDDGDALRLAVNLRMVIDPYAGLVGIPGLKLIPTINEGDTCAATRLAIVKAAAEIAKEMK